MRELFLNMQWPACIVVSVFIICLTVISALFIFLKYKSVINRMELQHKMDMQEKEWAYSWKREDKIHGWTSDKLMENLEKELKALKEEKEKMKSGEHNEKK